MNSAAHPNEAQGNSETLESLRADVLTLAHSVAEFVFSVRPHLLELLDVDQLLELRARYMVEYLAI